MGVSFVSDRVDRNTGLPYRVLVWFECGLDVTGRHPVFFPSTFISVHISPKGNFMFLCRINSGLDARPRNPREISQSPRTSITRTQFQ